jgi:hypothetical protein
MSAGNLKYFLILSLTFGTTPANAALDVKHAIKVFLWACMNRGISRGQQAPRPATPATEQKIELPYVLVARELGFQIDTKSVEQIEKEIEDFLATAPLELMAKEASGRNGLSGEPRGRSQIVTDILGDTTKTPEQKRALLREVYLPKLNASNHDILQLIRYRNSLQERIGGWGNLWEGYHQYVLNRTSDLESFSKQISSVDGLLYLPGPDADSFRVFAATHSHVDPLALISLANNGKPVEVSDLVVFQENKSEGGIAWSLKFTAVIRRPNEAGTPEGAKLVAGKTAPFTADHFLVHPFDVDKEKIALSKNADGTYLFHFRAGYRFAARIGSSSTPNGHDLEAVVTVALKDSGISANDVTIRRQREHTHIQLGETVDQNTRDRFETELALRVRELENPTQARASRQSPFRSGVDSKTAAAAQHSGFENDRAVLRAIGISKTDGTSSYYDSSPWHATYPLLMARNKGEYQLSVDDRIYAEGVHFDGLDTLNSARNQPMVPVQTSGGAYIVLSSKKPAPLWSGYLEYYCVFADREKADEFVRTHRFVVEQR